MFGLGVPELLLIMGILIIIFGAGKIADIGGALGKSVREFRQATDEPAVREQPIVKVETVETPR